VAVPRLPVVVVALGALAIGTVNVWPALASGGVPNTRFTVGHLVALGISWREHTWLRTTLLDWPDGATFRPLLWPVHLLAMATGPLAAFNVAYVLTPLANAAGGWALGRAVGAAPWGRAATALLCAWNPWVQSTLSNGQVEQALPGGAAAIWAAALAGPWWAPGVLVGAVGLAAPHVALAACLGLAVLALANPRRWRDALAGGVPVVAAVVLLHAYHVASFVPGAHVFAPRGSGGGVVAPLLPETVSWRSILFKPARSDAYLAVVHCRYLGFPLVVSAILGRRRDLLVTAAVLFVAASVPGWGFGEMAGALNPYRFVLGMTAACAGSAALWARTPARALLLAGVVWTETLVVRLAPFPTRALAVDVEPMPGGEGAVLDVPFPRPTCKDAADHYALQSVLHDRPAANALGVEWSAYGSRQAMLRQLDELLQDAERCPVALPGRLADLGFGSVVLHDHRNCPPTDAERACVSAVQRDMAPGRSP
jgi:hypothetical protein